jgi:hypothetical protein
MKITTLVLLACLLNIFISTINGETAKKFIAKHVPRPNLQDIKQIYKQTVSPFYENPYIPQEVDKLTEESNSIKKDLLKYMTKAEIVGPVQQKGVEENPTMYNTVIDSHPTSIRHPTLKPQSMVLKNGGGDALFDEKGDNNVSSNSEQGYENVIRGSIPVKISPSINVQANNGNFEDPIFIHKKEKVTEKVESLNTMLKKQIDGDMIVIRDKLKVADNKKEKIRVLKDGLERLDSEIEGISNKIVKNVEDILQAKEVGNRLNSVLNHYENTIRQNEACKLNLVDVVEIKKQLKIKLLKEIDGIRTSDNDFKVLQKVNQKDLKRVIKQIKKKIGLY